MNKKVFVIVVCLSIIILGIGGYFFYTNTFSPKKNNVDNNNLNSDNNDNSNNIQTDDSKDDSNLVDESDMNTTWHLSIPDEIEGFKKINSIEECNNISNLKCSCQDGDECNNLKVSDGKLYIDLEQVTSLYYNDDYILYFKQGLDNDEDSFTLLNRTGQNLLSQSIAGRFTQDNPFKVRVKNNILFFTDYLNNPTEGLKTALIGVNLKEDTLQKNILAYTSASRKELVDWVWNNKHDKFENFKMLNNLETCDNNPNLKCNYVCKEYDEINDGCINVELKINNISLNISDFNSIYYNDKYIIHYQEGPSTNAVPVDIYDYSGNLIISKTSEYLTTVHGGEGYVDTFSIRDNIIYYVTHSNKKDYSSSINVINLKDKEFKETSIAYSKTPLNG